MVSGGEQTRAGAVMKTLSSLQIDGAAQRKYLLLIIKRLLSASISIDACFQVHSTQYYNTPWCSCCVNRGQYTVLHHALLQLLSQYRAVHNTTPRRAAAAVSIQDSTQYYTTPCCSCCVNTGQYTVLHHAVLQLLFQYRTVHSTTQCRAAAAASIHVEDSTRYGTSIHLRGTAAV